MGMKVCSLVGYDQCYDQSTLQKSRACFYADNGYNYCLQGYTENYYNSKTTKKIMTWDWSTYKLGFSKFSLIKI